MLYYSKCNKIVTIQLEGVVKRMTKKLTRAILCGFIFALGMGTQIFTKAEENFQLPVAGMGLLLNEGISMADIEETYEVEPIALQVSSVTEKSVDELLRASEDAVEEVAEEEDFSTLVIAQVDNYVNVRSEASEQGEIVGKLYDNSVGELISEKNGWYHIISGNVSGFVKKEFVVTGEEAELLVPEVGTTYATVTTQTLFVRQESNVGSEIIGMCPEGEELLVEAILDGWIQLSIEAGDGYVSADYVTLHTEFVEVESKEEEEARLAQEEADRQAAREAAAQIAAVNQAAENQASGDENVEVAETETVKENIQAPVISDSSDMGSAVIEYASQFLGNPYVYGGTSLTNGTDCSGFTQSVYKNFGVDIPRTSTSQRTVGTQVDGLANALPGDIICYSGHVALYMGNNTIIHASTSRTGIITGTADYRTIITIRRIF